MLFLFIIGLSFRFILLFTFQSRSFPLRIVSMIQGVSAAIRFHSGKNIDTTSIDTITRKTIDTISTEKNIN